MRNRDRSKCGIVYRLSPHYRNGRLKDLNCGEKLHQLIHCGFDQLDRAKVLYRTGFSCTFVREPYSLPSTVT